MKLIKFLPFLLIFSIQVYGKDEVNPKPIKDVKMIQKIVDIAEHQVPELKKIEENVKKTYYQIDAPIVFPPLKKGEYNSVYILNDYYTLCYLGTMFLYITQDLKTVKLMPVDVKLPIEPVSIDKWRKDQKKYIEKRKLEEQNRKNENEKNIKKIQSRIKLDKKNILLNKKYKKISLEDLTIYLKEVMPHIEMRESYVKIIKPKIKSTFELLNTPSSDKQNKLEQKYHIVVERYTGEKSEYTKIFFIPEDLNEKEILVLEYMREAEIKNKAYLKSTNIEKNSPVDFMVIWLISYFEKYPKEEQNPTEKTKKEILSHFIT